MDNKPLDEKLKALKEKFETKPDVKKAIDKKMEYVNKPIYK